MLLSHWWKNVNKFMHPTNCSSDKWLSLKYDALCADQIINKNGDESVPSQQRGRLDMLMDGSLVLKFELGWISNEHQFN